MRVLHVIPAVASRYGGPSQAVLGTVRALREAGLDAHIATTDADGPGRLGVPFDRFVDFGGSPAIFFRREWSERFKVSRGLARWLDGRVADYDLVHIHAVFSHSSLAAARACRKRGVPYIVRPLGSLAEWALARKARTKRVVWRIAVGRMMREAAAVHYTTDEERRQSEERLGLGRGVVIPVGIDGEESGASAAGAEAGRNGAAFRRRFGLGEDPYVLSLARLHPVKRLDLLVESFLAATAADGFSRWRLVIAGDGEPGHARALEELARDRGADRVVFTGWLDGPDKAEAISGAALLALLSHQESFGIAALEALSRSVPVLVSPAVGLAEEIERAGAGWVADGGPWPVARTLETALADPAERAARGAAGRALVEARFAWPPVARDLVRLYGEVLGKRPASGGGRAPVSVVILTHREERNLPACLESVREWAGEVHVVDSYSDDATVALAREAGARVVQHPFEGHSAQWAWALANLPLRFDWVLGLDADQRVTPELARSVAAAVHGPGDAGVADGGAADRGVAGYYAARRQIFRGCWIRHGGYYPKYLLKLFRRDAVRLDPHDLVDHHFRVAGRTARLAGDLVEDNANESDLAFWIEKHRAYARRLALEEHGRGAAAGGPVRARPFGDPDERVAWQKRVWSRMPLYVRPGLYFLYRYVFRLGFLDGRQGLVFHFLHAFWYRFLIDIHLGDLRRNGRVPRPGDDSGDAGDIGVAAGNAGEAA